MKNRGQEHTIPLYASHLGDWIGGVMHTLENEIVSAEWCILRIFWDIVCPWLPRNLEQLTPRCDTIDSHKDLCHLCLKNPRYLMYDQCEFCYYRLKFAFKNCAFALVIIKNSLKNRKTNVLMVCTVDTTDIDVAVWCPRTPRSFSKIRKIRQPVCQGPRWV